MIEYEDDIFEDALGCIYENEEPIDEEWTAEVKRSSMKALTFPTRKWVSDNERTDCSAQIKPVGSQKRNLQDISMHHRKEPRQKTGNGRCTPIA